MHLRRVSDRRSVVPNEVLSRSVVDQFSPEREIRIWRAGDDHYARHAAGWHSALPPVQYDGPQARAFVLPRWKERWRHSRVLSRNRTTSSVIQAEQRIGLSS